MPEAIRTCRSVGPFRRAPSARWGPLRSRDGHDSIAAISSLSSAGKKTYAHGLTILLQDSLVVELIERVRGVGSSSHEQNFSCLQGGR